MGAIVWLASYPKSGNTWLRAFLHNLLRDPTQPMNINQLDQFCLGEPHRSWYQPHSKTPTMELDNQALANLRPLGQKAMTAAFPDSVFVKTHSYLGEWCGVPIHTMKLTAGGIYVVRNPLDVVISMTHHFGLSIDDAIDKLNDEGAATENSEKNVPEIVTSWSKNVRSWTEKPNPLLHVVRYEDMSDRPNAAFGGIARFLQLNPPRARLEKAIRFSSFKVLKSQEKKQDFRERSPLAEAFFREGKRDQWKKHLNGDQITRIIDANRTQMARFGYIPDGYKEKAQA